MSAFRRRPREGRPPTKPVAKLTQNGYLSLRVAPVRCGEETILEWLRGAGSGDYKSAGSEVDAAYALLSKGLVAAKTPLDSIPAEEFNRHMHTLDLYTGLKKTLRGTYKAQVATNASLKIYEILCQEGLLEWAGEAGEAGAAGAAEEKEPARGVERPYVFCNAELPGAFVSMINHYVRTRHPQACFDWVASSYLPAAAAAAGDTSKLDDQYGFYAANRERWLMGPRPNALPRDFQALSGDLTDADVVAALADAVHARETGPGPSGARLATSDAGIRIEPGSYHLQEELTAALNFGQALCGMLALAPGGSLVYKQYTFMRPYSRSLIALVSAFFDETVVSKPVTSRPVNSEVYIVAKGFRGMGQPVADALLASLAACQSRPPCDGPPLLPPGAMVEAEASLLQAAQRVYGQQIAHLREAVALRRRPGLRRALEAAAARVQEQWLADNPVTPLRDIYRIQDGLLPDAGERRLGHR